MRACAHIRPVIIAVLFLLTIAYARTASPAAHFTFNTALPVADGEGFFRVPVVQNHNRISFENDYTAILSFRVNH